jgi:hypothetical protein
VLRRIDVPAASASFAGSYDRSSLVSVAETTVE